jgi:iron complex transport system ATP-binding protein
MTDTLDLADRPVDELSGGQRQSVWIAMSLAQQTDILLIDEPTTFLDLAARYADHLIAVSGGRLHAAGGPHEVLTPRSCVRSSAWTAR